MSNQRNLRNMSTAPLFKSKPVPSDQQVEYLDDLEKALNAYFG